MTFLKIWNKANWDFLQQDHLLKRTCYFNTCLSNLNGTAEDDNIRQASRILSFNRTVLRGPLQLVYYCCPLDVDGVEWISLTEITEGLILHCVSIDVLKWMDRWMNILWTITWKFTFVASAILWTLTLISLYHSRSLAIDGAHNTSLYISGHISDSIPNEILMYLVVSLNFIPQRHVPHSPWAYSAHSDTGESLLSCRWGT